MFKFFSYIRSKFKLSNASIFNLLALIFNILYIVVFAFLGGSANTGNTIFQGVVAFCLTVLLVEIYVIRDQLPDHFDTVRQNLVAEIDSLKNQLSEYKKAEAFTRNVKNSLNGEVFSILTEKLKKAVEISSDDQGFSIKGECWVLESYENLWEKLSEAQQKFGTELRCFVVHDCNFSFWLTHPKALRFYNLQREFLERRYGDQKGEVNIILCGKGNQADNQADQIAQKIIGLSDRVFYYNTDNPVVGTLFPKEFLVVTNCKLSLEEVIATVIWTEFDHMESPTKATHKIDDKYDGKSLLEIWHQIVKVSTELPKDSSTST